MADVIASVLSATKSISREANHHVYKELTDLQTLTTDPALASPYLLASAVSTVSKTTNASSGNFTLTLNFPKAGVSVTTANIAYNAAAAAIQTAIDNALNGEVIAATYSAGDVDAAVTGNVSANALTVTANGTTVNGYNLIVTTSNVDLDAYEMTVTQNTVGTLNRPAEACLQFLGVLSPSGTLPYQGKATVEASEYALGDNPFSVSPALQAALAQDVIVNEDKVIGAAIREALPCVENR